MFLTDANHIILGYRVKLLEERILRDGKVFPGEVLKVGGFLNHLIDDTLMEEIGKEIYSLYKCDQVTKILTLEASGIAIACYAAMYLHVPVLFAKKSKTANISKDVYSAEVKSYTHGNVNTIMVEKEFLNSSDRVLIVDDFLAHGEALRGLIACVLSRAVCFLRQSCPSCRQARKYIFLPNVPAVCSEWCRTCCIQIGRASCRERV